MTEDIHGRELREILDSMMDPESWGGIEHKKELITYKHSWARLELAHDAYYPAQIAGIIDRLEPTATKRQVYSPQNPDLEVYLAKLGSSYVLVYDETVDIVGENEKVNEIGAAIIMNANVLERPHPPGPNIEGDVSCKIIIFQYDTMIPGDLIPELEKLSAEFEIETIEPLDSDEDSGFSARIGQSNYIRALMGTIDVVGTTEDVNRITEALTENHKDIIEFIDDFCDAEYTVDKKQNITDII